MKDEDIIREVTESSDDNYYMGEVDDMLFELLSDEESSQNQFGVDYNTKNTGLERAKDIGCECVDWIHPIQYTVARQMLVNTIMNSSIKCKEFLDNQLPPSQGVHQWKKKTISVIQQ